MFELGFSQFQPRQVHHQVPSDVKKAFKCAPALNQIFRRASLIFSYRGLLLGIWFDFAPAKNYGQTKVFSSSDFLRTEVVRLVISLGLVIEAKNVKRECESRQPYSSSCNMIARALILNESQQILVKEMSTENIIKILVKLQGTVILFGQGMSGTLSWLRSVAGETRLICRQNVRKKCMKYFPYQHSAK